MSRDDCRIICWGLGDLGVSVNMKRPRNGLGGLVRVCASLLNDGQD